MKTCFCLSKTHSWLTTYAQKRFESKNRLSAPISMRNNSIPIFWCLVVFLILYTVWKVVWYSDFSNGLCRICSFWIGHCAHSVVIQLKIFQSRVLITLSRDVFIVMIVDKICCGKVDCCIPLNPVRHFPAICFIMLICIT